MKNKRIFFVIFCATFLGYGCAIAVATGCNFYLSKLYQANTFIPLTGDMKKGIAANDLQAIKRLADDNLKNGFIIKNWILGHYVSMPDQEILPQYPNESGLLANPFGVTLRCISQMRKFSERLYELQAKVSSLDKVPDMAANSVLSLDWSRPSCIAEAFYEAYANGDPLFIMYLLEPSDPFVPFGGDLNGHQMMDFYQQYRRGNVRTYSLSSPLIQDANLLFCGVLHTKGNIRKEMIIRIEIGDLDGDGVFGVTNFQLLPQSDGDKSN